MNQRFSDVAAKAAKLQAAKPETTPPVFTIPDGAGVESYQRLVVQIALTQRDYKMAGAAINTKRGKMHRLKITRVAAYEGLSEASNTAMGWRIKPKAEDDGVCRPSGRHDLIMYAGGPSGMSNVKPWVTGYTMVAQAATWAEQALTSCRGDDQFGLIMVVDTTDWTTKTWDDTNAGKTRTFQEALITSVLHLEVVKLVEPGRALEALDQSDDADDTDYMSEFDEE